MSTVPYWRSAALWDLFAHNADTFNLEDLYHPKNCSRFIPLFVGALTAKECISCIVEYFQDVMPSNITSLEPWEQPTAGQLVDLYIKIEDDLLVMWRNTTTTKRCRAQVCEEMGWTGYADVLGIGVLSATVIEFGCMTMYLAALLFAYYRRRDEAPAKRFWLPGPELIQLNQHIDRILNAFLGTFHVFTSTALFYAVFLLVAYVIVYAGAVNNGFLVVVGATFQGLVGLSLFPAAIAWALNSHQARRKFFRLVVGCMIVVLWTASVWLVATTKHFNSADIDKLWTANCYNSPFTIPQFTVYAVGSTLAIALFLCATMETMRKLTSMHFHTFKVVLIVSLYVITIILLVEFMSERQNLIATSKKTNTDNSWGIGQVLALGTWVPLGVDFFYILFFGTERGLNSMIAPPWTIRN